jgi:hypothetical protein
MQHESKFLWKLHSKHHAIDTPSPFSTLFINPTDAALQVRLQSVAFEQQCRVQLNNVTKHQCQHRQHLVGRLLCSTNQMQKCRPAAAAAAPHVHI